MQVSIEPRASSRCRKEGRKGGGGVEGKYLVCREESRLIEAYEQRGGNQINTNTATASTDTAVCSIDVVMIIPVAISDVTAAGTADKGCEVCNVHQLRSLLTQQ